MEKAIGMVELTSIARGIETGDDMVKAAQVTLLRATTVCPGKYMVIVGGDTGAVRASLKAGLAKGAEFVVDSLFIPNVHEQLFPAIAGTQEVVDPQAIGVVEFYSIAAAIKAADEAAKAAQVTLIEVRTGYAVGGKGFFTLTGDVGAVRAAVKAAEKDSEYYIGSTVIPHPAKQVIESLL
ncbi:MAG: BMC domain-containing protein [Eubacteriales bacterium]|nr:BMC domain-containing protein [Eubacteriales bacterium]